MLADDVEHRVLLDVHVDGVEHEPHGRRADPGDQRRCLGGGVVETDLEVVHGLEHDAHRTLLGRASNACQRVRDPLVREAVSGSSVRRPWSSPTTTSARSVAAISTISIERRPPGRGSIRQDSTGRGLRSRTTTQT